MAGTRDTRASRSHRPRRKPALASPMSSAAPECRWRGASDAIQICWCTIALVVTSGFVGAGSTTIAPGVPTEIPGPRSTGRAPAHLQDGGQDTRVCMLWVGRDDVGSGVIKWRGARRRQGDRAAHRIRSDASARPAEQVGISRRSDARRRVIGRRPHLAGERRSAERRESRSEDAQRSARVRHDSRVRGGGRGHGARRNALRAESPDLSRRRYRAERRARRQSRCPSSASRGAATSGRVFSRR